MNNFEFYSAVNTTLNIIIENIEQKNILQEDYSLRVGSIIFEENLKKEINKKKQEIIDKVNKIFKTNSLDLKLDSIQSDLNETEAGNRSYYDILLTFENDLEELYTVPVNIKITLGKSKDNVCGWKGLASALYPNITIDNISKNKFYQLVKEKEITNEISDYFIWSFNKNDGKEMLNNHKCLSLLNIKKEDMHVNINQSMPLQINTRTCRKIKNVNIEKERKLLVSKILTTMLRVYEEEIILISEALKNVSK